NAFAQKSVSVVELSFTAGYYGQYVPLDSILVENLSKGCDTALYFPDTVLVLDIGTGIGTHYLSQDDGLIIFPNFPNPFREETSIRVYVPEKQRIRFAVNNEVGMELNSLILVLDKGLHSFTLTGGNEHLYIFTASCKGTIKAKQLLAFPDQVSTNCRLVYKGLVSSSSLILKKGESVDGFTFSPSDSLRYTGYAQTPAGVAGSDVTSNKPEQIQNYQFKIIEGIPCPDIPALNYGGQVYITVQIGTQCWFKENLNIGTMITTGNNNQTNDSIIEKYCYNNDAANCNVYGGLYQWDEMMQYVVTPGAQGICPNGWHLPTDAEWTNLTTYLGGTSVAGGALKEAGYVHWQSPNTGATNSSGFTALPGGERAPSGNFVFLSQVGWFGSSSVYSMTETWMRHMNYDNTNVDRLSYIKTYGFSARCLKN
ncbi:MAG: fibrobacter succinogenes major paralogous domain-containing protein, partial [Bacteroidales bacterium]